MVLPQNDAMKTKTHTSLVRVKPLKVACLHFHTKKRLKKFHSNLSDFFFSKN